ncbi:hypothetical protein J4214_00600 [Candidatus Woesearchaeota archaeon]|nr:hypothetical protein [Candidatus Woesearchaeota archaeon]
MEEEEKQDNKQEIQHLSKHERRELKRLRKEEERNKTEENRKKKKSTKDIITYSVITIIVIGFIYLIYFLVTRAPSNNTESDYDLSGIPSEVIHWHADINIGICGDRKQLPEPLPGGEIGNGLLHTHDKTTNKNSMPNSDGNGVMHLEGNVRSNPGESTLIKFMRNIGVRFSETEIMDKKNGDLCNDKNGNVTIYVNGKKYDKNINYFIPKDNDIIDIKFE